jgi:hypothetical protein
MIVLVQEEEDDSPWKEVGLSSLPQLFVFFWSIFWSHVLVLLVFYGCLRGDFD